MSVRITPQEITEALDSSSCLSKTRPKRLSVEAQVRSLRLTVRNDIEVHMQAWMILLDECLRFYIHFERLQWTRKFNKKQSTFAMQVGRLRALCLSIRELIMLGQESPAHALARVFLDDLELACVIVDDPDFALSYMCEDDDHDENKYWKENIGYGRIYPRFMNFLQRAGLSNQSASAEIDAHRSAKNSLSGHVHPSPASTFRGLAYPSWTNPGLIKIKTLGHLTTHIPGLCHFIANHTQIFSASVINLMISDPPPEVLAGYRRRSAAMRDMVASATVLQTLLNAKGPMMEAEYVRVCSI